MCICTICRHILISFCKNTCTVHFVRYPYICCKNVRMYLHKYTVFRLIYAHTICLYIQVSPSVFKYIVGQLVYCMLNRQLNELPTLQEWRYPLAGLPLGYIFKSVDTGYGGKFNSADIWDAALFGSVWKREPKVT
jgi:hypothetical protein